MIPLFLFALALGGTGMFMLSNHKGYVCARLVEDKAIVAMMATEKGEQLGDNVVVLDLCSGLDLTRRLKKERISYAVPQGEYLVSYIREMKTTGDTMPGLLASAVQVAIEVGIRHVYAVVSKAQAKTLNALGFSQVKASKGKVLMVLDLDRSA